jgi:hypothetical protein
MNHLRIVAVLALGLVVGSCQTISEEMPASSFGNLPSVSPVPIVVIQLPQPAPASSIPPSSPTTPPSNSGGGGGGSTPPSSPAQNEPSNGCWRNNCNPIASIHAHVYYVQCGGEAIPNTKFASEASSSCDVVLDATPKDARGLATNSSGRIDWNISGGRTVVNAGSFTPKIIGGGRGGEITFSATVDGVTSNSDSFSFR